jgi:HEAT repeat protein
LIAGYMAGEGLAGQAAREDLLDQPEWQGREEALHYLAARDDGAWVDRLLADQTEDPLMRVLLAAGRWLRDAPEDCPWRSTVLRQLAACLHQKKLPFELRARALSALVTAGGPGVTVLLHQTLTSPEPNLRQLAALGCGAMRDTAAVKDITALLADRTPNVRRAACLALVSTGDKPALDAIAAALLNGDEDLRRAAAEALANHPEEGYPTLEDGSTLEDLHVRRAAVSGLARVRQPWAVKILEKMQLEDGQWVVQNAATQALEALSAPDAHIPRPLPALSETPWLIAFAGEKGIGVVPGKPAFDLVLLALKEGQDEQRLAAMNYLGLSGEEGAVLPLYQIYYACEGELRDAALRALWLLAASGVRLPTPVQFGLV